MRLAVWRSKCRWRRVLAGGGRSDDGPSQLPPYLHDTRLPPRRSISGRRWVELERETQPPSNVSCFTHGRMRETSAVSACLARFPMSSRLPMRVNPVQRPCTNSPYFALCSISPILPTAPAFYYKPCVLLHGICFFLSLALQQTGTYLPRVAPARTCISRL